MSRIPANGNWTQDYSVPWKADPCCKAVPALQQKWTHKFPYTFSPFSLIRRVVRKVEQERARLILITPTCNPSLDIHDLFGDSSREIQEIIKREVKSPAGRKFWGSSPLQKRRGNRRQQQTFFVKTFSKYPIKVRVQIASCLSTTQLLEMDLEKVQPLIKKSFWFRNPVSSSSRKAKLLIRKLGAKFRVTIFVLWKYHFKPRNISSDFKTQTRRKSSNRIWSSRNVEERCYSSNADNTRKVFEQYIFSFKGRLRKSASRELEIFEKFHTLPTFQNGGNTSHKGVTTTRSR